MPENLSIKHNLKDLEQIATRLRLDVVEMIAPTRQGYVQQGLGAADIFASLYFGEAKIDPNDPAWENRDRVVLSTAHNTAIFYATLARRGYFDVSRLATYCRDGSPLEINASERLGKMIEATCGSLGQGLSVGLGMAISLRRQNKSSQVFVILGDGELQEGQVWEAAMAAGSWGVSNLCLIIDYNLMQVEGHMDQVMKAEPLFDKFASFGFDVIESDGNDLASFLNALSSARANMQKPTCIIAHTIPGKGVSNLEGLYAHMLRFPEKVAQDAKAELEGKLQS